MIDKKINDRKIGERVKAIFLSSIFLSNTLTVVQPETQRGGRPGNGSLTQELIDAAIALKGHYYLPYRLHATRDQFQRAYPQAGDFFRWKRHFDPDEIFQNEFYRKYR